MAWDKLEKVYQNQGLVLVLGAGISIGCGLPNWMNLLKRLAVVCFGDSGPVVVDELRRFNKRLVFTVERSSAALERSSKSKLAAGTRKIHAYHMHGYLRFDKKMGQPAKESTRLVITEQEYFDFVNNPNSLFNYTFLFLLREYPCLFIGLSMTDDNIRRLLHYSMTERREGLVEEPGNSNPKATADAPEVQTVRHFAIFKRFQSENLNWLTETSLLNLGTRVLWVEDFAEIPGRLGQVYESTGNTWQTVF